MARGENDRTPAGGECERKALDLLARRPHFRKQLEAKLAQRSFEDDAIRTVCDELERKGYLDDLECARSLATGSLRRKGYGPRRLRAELVRRGAGDEAVDQAVTDAFADGEQPLLAEVARKWLARRSWHRERLARHLESKGFSSGAIWGVLRALEEERNSPEAASRRPTSKTRPVVREPRSD